MRLTHVSMCLVASLLFFSTSQAAVTLTFDSDTEGFVSDVASVAWSDYNGGSLAVSADGGWSGNGTKLDIHNNAELWAELQDAVANGGTISYDVFIEPSDVTTTGAPLWFETVQIANSGGDGGIGGWDQEIVSYGLGSEDWPLTSTVTATVTSEILFGAPSEDGNLQFDPTDGWSQLFLGLNNDGDNVVSATVYFDDLTVTAVPEPSAATLLLGMLGGLACFARRRRR